MFAELGLSANDLALVLAIYVVGAMVKGSLGFGMPLVSISMLPLVIPVDLALALNALLLIPINLLQFVTSRRMAASVTRFWPVLAGHIIGVPLGVAFLASIPTDALALMLGLFVVFFVGLSFKNPYVEIPSRLERPIGAVTGAAAGFVGALTSSPGPIYVMYLVGMRLDRNLFFGVLAINLILVGVLVSGSFASVGLLTIERALLAAFCLAPVLVGMWLGNRLSRSLPQTIFRKAVLIFLLLLGLNMIVRAVI